MCPILSHLYFVCLPVDVDAPFPKMAFLCLSFIRVENINRRTLSVFFPSLDLFLFLRFSFLTIICFTGCMVIKGEDCRHACRRLFVSFVLKTLFILYVPLNFTYIYAKSVCSVQIVNPLYTRK